MRTIKTLNSTYEVEDGKIRRTEPHPANNHALADGEWHDLDYIGVYGYGGRGLGSYAIRLADGRGLTTSAVVADTETETVR